MNEYGIPARPTTDGNVHFDSRLEADWAGTIRHIGLRWKREPFVLREGHGRTTYLNIVARPDFFLPDLAVIFECKPTAELVVNNEERWRHEAAISGLPVVVTESYPRSRWVNRPPCRVRDLPLDNGQETIWEYLAGIGPPSVRMPPVMWLYDEQSPKGRQTYFAACPDCTAVGLVSVSELAIGWLESFLTGNLDHPPNHAPLTDLWLSRCRHEPKWSIGGLTDAMYDDRLFGRIAP